MVTLPHLSVIRFSDADAGSFLHNQVSADVLALANGESTFACYCEPKGRVLALMLIFRADDDYYVLLSSSLATTITDRLKIYVMRSKVSIEILKDCSVTGVQSSNAPDLTSTLIPPVPMPASDHWYVVRSDEKVADADTALQDAWKLSELKLGITWMCPETSGQFLPQMLGFDQLGAVNYRKGCYPGQEIVARTHYLGKVKRHPRLLYTSAIICPNPLDKIHILNGDNSYGAVITDCGHREDGGGCLFVITRMDPEMVADMIEYQGQLAPLSDS